MDNIIDISALTTITTTADDSEFDQALVKIGLNRRSFTLVERSTHRSIFNNGMYYVVADYEEGVETLLYDTTQLSVPNTTATPESNEWYPDFSI